MKGYFVSRNDFSAIVVGRLCDLWDWFSHTDNALAFTQMFATIVTAIATFMLWRVTRVLAVETKTLAKMTSRPFVVVSMEPVPGVSAHNILNLVLRNTGNATAFDITVRVSPYLPKVGKEPLVSDTETPFKVSLLPPNQAIPLQGLKLENIHDKNFEFNIGWSCRPGAEQIDTIRYFIGGEDLPKDDWGVKSLHNIAEELVGIRIAIEKNVNNTE